MKCIKKIVFSTCFLLAQTVWADQQATQALMQDLSQYQQVQGDFTQTLSDQNGVVLQTNQGTFALSRPTQEGQAGKFRWDTQSPKQLLIADSKKIWFYDSSLQQVTVQKQQNIAAQNSPAMLLSGDLTKISQQYQIKLTTSQVQQVFTLTPLNTKDTFFSQVKITFVPNAVNKTPPQILNGMEITDNLGQKTKIQFTNLSTQVPANLFQFTPPKGVDVVQG